MCCFIEGLNHVGPPPLAGCGRIVIGGGVSPGVFAAPAAYDPKFVAQQLLKKGKFQLGD